MPDPKNIPPPPPGFVPIEQVQAQGAIPPPPPGFVPIEQAQAAPTPQAEEVPWYKRAVSALSSPVADLMGGAGVTARGLLGELTGNPIAYDMAKLEQQSGPSMADADHPIKAALRRGVSGIATDTADTIAGFTSPISLGTIGLGAAGKVPGAIGTIAKAVTPLIGAGFAAQGANQVVNPEGDTQADRLQSQLMGGAMVAGGSAGAADLANPAIRAGNKLANKVQAPLGDMVVKPRGTTPAESFSPQELKAYADANGIPLNAAQATEHTLPRNLQSAGERATVGGTAVRNQQKAAQAAIQTHAENLINQMSPNTPTLADAGAALKQNVESAVDAQRQQSRQNYAAIDRAANGVTVNLKSVKQLAEGILDNSKFVREKVSSLDNKRASTILKGIAELPDNATFSQVQDLRSALLDESRSPDLAISEKAQAWIKQLDSEVDGAMVTAAQQVPGLEQDFRAANQQWKNLKNDFTNPRSPLSQILAEPDPSKIPQKLTQKGQIGGSPFNAQLLDKYGIDKGAVKSVILNDLLSKDFKLFNNKSLGGYSDDFLQSVFTPQELANIYKTGAIARSVGVNTNPSGTAAVQGAMQDVQKPIRSLVPKAIAAFGTNNAAVNKWWMQPPSLALSSPVAARPAGLVPAALGARRRDRKDKQ